MFYDTDAGYALTQTHVTPHQVIKGLKFPNKPIKLTAYLPGQDLAIYGNTAPFYKQLDAMSKMAYDSSGRRVSIVVRTPFRTIDAEMVHMAGTWKFAFPHDELIMGESGSPIF